MINENGQVKAIFHNTYNPAPNPRITLEAMGIKWAWSFNVPMGDFVAFFVPEGENLDKLPSTMEIKYRDPAIWRGSYLSEEGYQAIMKAAKEKCLE